MLEKFFKRDFAVFSGLFFLAFCAYSFSMGSDFRVLDDHASILTNDTVRSFSNLKHVLFTSFFGGNTYYRPLVSLSFMIENYFFGLNVFYYHLTNICLHVLVGFFIFLFTKELMKKRDTAFLIAVFYVLHPIHCEAVSSIAGRAVLLCALGYVSAFAFYLRSIRVYKNKHWIGLSWACFFLALLSKETAVTLPLIILCYEYYFINDRTGVRTQWKASLKRLAPYFLILLIYLLLRRAVGITNVPFWPDFSSLMLGVLTFLRAVLTYLRIFIAPYDLHFDRSRAYFETFLSVELLLTAMVFCVFIFNLVRHHKKLSKEAKFFLGWGFLTFLPASQLLPVMAQYKYAATSEHLIYIPSIGLFALAILMYRKTEKYFKEELKETFKLGKTIFVVFLVYLYTVTIGQNIYASQEYAVLRQSLQYDPYNVRVRTSYAAALAMKSLYEEAEVEFKKVLEIEPSEIKARIGLGLTLANRGKYFEGIEEYEKVKFPGKYEDLLKENLSLAYRGLFYQYDKKIQEDPNNKELYYSLGVAYTKTRDINQAIELFNQALAIDPNYKNALFNLASIYDTQGRQEEAFSLFSKILSLPGPQDEIDVHVFLRLSEAYRLTGDTVKAQAYFNKATSLRGKVNMDNLKVFRRVSDISRD